MKKSQGHPLLTVGLLRQKRVNYIESEDQVNKSTRFLLEYKDSELESAEEHDLLLFEERCVNRLMLKRRTDIQATQDEKLKIITQRFDISRIVKLFW